MDWERYVTIIIRDENGEMIQEIDGIVQGGQAGWALPRLDDWFGIEFDDFNFDGYLDMFMLSAINHGSARGAWAYFWLWNPETGQFEQNKRLSEISDFAWLETCHETHRIIVSSRGSGGGPWATHYYKYENGDFIVTSSVFSEWISRRFVPSYIQTTYSDYLRGKTIVETDPPNSLPDYTIRKSVDINPNMDFPTHEVTLEMWRLPDGSDYRVFGYQYEIAIVIQQLNQYGQTLSWQAITGLRAGYGYGRWIAPDLENPLNLHFADFNGDGYLDMALRRSPPMTGGMADDPHYFWLFDPESPSWQGSFVRNYSLGHVASFGQVMSAENGYVTIFTWHAFTSGWATYAYADGEFVQICFKEAGIPVDDAT